MLTKEQNRVKLAIILKLEDTLITRNYEELAQVTFDKLIELTKKTRSPELAPLLDKVLADPSFHGLYMAKFDNFFSSLHCDPSLDSDGLLSRNLQRILSDLTGQAFPDLCEAVSKDCSASSYDLFPDAKESLEQLTQHDIFLHSSLPPDLTREILEKLGADKIISQIFCEGKGFETAIRQLEEMKYEKYKICVIGNMLDREMTIGVRQGVRTGWFTGKPWNEERNNESISLVNRIDFAFSSYQQLPALINILLEDAVFIMKTNNSDYRQLDLPIKRRFKVAYYIPARNVRELASKKFITSNNSILFYPLQINASLEAQGPFIGLFQKTTDLMVEEFVKKKGKRFSTLQDFTEKHEKTMVTIAPLRRIKLTLYRTDTNAAIEAALNTELLRSIMNRHGLRFRLPYTRIIRDSDPDLLVSILKEDIKDRRCDYPFLLKLAESCQTVESHTLAICVDEKGLKDALDLDLYKGKEMLIQQMIKHSATLYKLYTLGEDYVSYFFRKSLPNVLPIKGHAIFDSQKPFPEEWLAGTEEPVDKLDKDFAYEIARALLRELNLSVLGMDYIIEERTGDYMIIDINYFSTFKHELDLNEQVTHHILKSYNEKIKGIKT